MTHRINKILAATAAALTLTAAHAQVMPKPGNGPFGSSGYVGINLGRSNYDTSCGTIRLTCDQSKVAGKIYAGAMFNSYLGTEVGYFNMGRADRAGGTTEAQGGNISLVGRLPLNAFSLFVKGGATYGRTRVSADTLSLAPTGKRSGWGGSYGAGVGLDVGSNSTVVLEWERHRLDFAGADKQDVDATTLGYRFRF